jgi:signal transduction histidine kinase
VATIRQPLLLIDEEKRVVLANDAFGSMCALSGTEADGLPLEALPGTMWSAPALAALIHGVAALAENDAPPSVVLKERFGASPRTLRVTAQRLQDPDDAVRLVLLAFDDITAQDQSDTAHEEQTAQLTRSNRELQEFAAIASHDLQEPLRKIQSFGALLEARAGAALDATSRDYLSRMMNSAARLSAMVRDLLAVSRLEAAPLVRELVPLNELVTAVLGDLGSAIAEAGARVNVERLPVVSADRTQLRHVLQNLLSNALKFRQTDVPLEIGITGHTTVRDGVPVVELTVADNGIGIRAADQAVIFGMFTRVASRTRYPGSGIGLALCFRIAARHGGHIFVDSDIGRGSRFTLVLPEHP